MASNKRFVILAMACLILSLSLSGCLISPDVGLVSLMLIEPPGRLVYVIGQDQEVDVSGGKLIEYVDRKGGLYTKINQEEYGPDFFDGKYFYPDVNFAEEGTYIVSFAKIERCSRTVYFQYTVQVVSPGQYHVNTAFPDDGFTFEKLESTYCENVTAIMTASPNNIIYPLGYEGEIDLSGIALTRADDKEEQEYNISELDYTLESDVDFNTPGSYIAKVFFTDDRGRDLWFCFTVAVAEPIEE